MLCEYHLHFTVVLPVPHEEEILPARVRMNPMFSFETYVLWDVWFLFPDKLAFLIKQVLEVKTSYIVSAMKSLPPWEEGDKLLLNVVFG